MKTNFPNSNMNPNSPRASHTNYVTHDSSFLKGFLRGLHQINMERSESERNDNTRLMNCFYKLRL